MEAWGRKSVAQGLTASVLAQGYTCNHCTLLPAFSIEGMLGKHSIHWNWRDWQGLSGMLAMMRDLDIS